MIGVVHGEVYFGRDFIGVSSRSPGRTRQSRRAEQPPSFSKPDDRATPYILAGGKPFVVIVRVRGAVQGFQSRDVLYRHQTGNRAAAVDYPRPFDRVPAGGGAST